MENNAYLELRNAFKKVMLEYASVYEYVKDNKDWKNPFRNVIADDIPNLIRQCTGIGNPYNVVGSYGKGCWTVTPWVAIFDTGITKSAQKGVYIVYLFNKDTKELFLAFATAATEVIGVKTDSTGKALFYGVTKNKSPEMREKLSKRANEIRAVILDDYFSNDTNIKTGSTVYDYGTVYYKRYTLADFPSGEVLVDDLKKMLDIYKKYHDLMHNPNSNKDGYGDDTQSDTPPIELPLEPENPPVEIKKDVEKMTISTKDAIAKIKAYIAAKGFSYNDDLIDNFYLSLKSKPFVILAGTSGTGKTRLVKLFAEAIGAGYKLVSVRPDWSDGSDLFGHYDLNGNFIKGPVCECFEMAYANPNKPVFLCMDEMNLARVEYYLSDFLSIIESREWDVDGVITTTPIAQYKNGIPDNLYIVGTVNMDETTFPFSKKVLDRANTIEFNYVDLIPNFDAVLEEPEKMQLPNAFLCTKYLVLSKDCTNEKDYVSELCEELQKINQILLGANAHVGYRVRDEVIFYMLNNKVAGNLLTHNQAMDNEIMQKILPRIQGSSVSVRDMLCELFKLCAADHDQRNGESDSEKMRKVLNDDTVASSYRKSAEKIELMVRRFDEDGFTSYWL